MPRLLLDSSNAKRNFSQIACALAVTNRLTTNTLERFDDSREIVHQGAKQNEHRKDRKNHQEYGHLILLGVVLCALRCEAVIVPDHRPGHSVVSQGSRWR